MREGATYKAVVVLTFDIQERSGTLVLCIFSLSVVRG